MDKKDSMNRMWWGLLALNAGIFFTLNLIDNQLKTAITPQGILSFEFCGFTQTCSQAVAEWGESGKLYTAFSLGVDYLFLMAYPALLFVWGRLRSTGYTPYLVWIAGISDAIENYFLLHVLLGATEQGMLAGIFATIKFSLLAIFLLWLITSRFRQKQD